MKKVLSILLTIIMLFTMIPANVFAAEGITVKLVSFMRGDVSDLRSSELLEVQVEGYEGNPRELTYKWTSSMGTYLYIYNSHNMYGINNTYGEYEIYNTDKKINRSSNVEEDRSGNKTLTLAGFMWASVYGAYTYNGGNADSALKGTVKVEVFDKSGKSLGSDSFSSFKAHNLDGDLDNVVIGLFEGDRMNALDLLGQSGIVHITCTSSSVSSADILKGDEHIAIETEKKDKNTYNYFIKGVKAGDNSTNGDAQLEINIKKTSCKFHYNTSGTAEPTVYVFKKPTTTTTTTTLTLIDDIDSRCEYFIDGNKGEKQSDGTIIFTGLTPNTDYTVEVRAEYKDGNETKYVYGYVEDTTKPVYKATVKTYLDDVLTDIADIHGEDVTLYLHEDKENAEYIALDKASTGVYTAEVINGAYFPWHIEAGDHYHKAKEFKLIIENANGHLDLHHYSVTYDANGGTFADGNDTKKEIYPSTSVVNATDSIPVREGFIFTGWEYNGKVIGSGKQVTASITSPITLKAKWEKAVNVTINVTIDHKTTDGFDPNPTRADLDVDFLEMTSDSPAFVETGDKLHFRTDKVTDENDNAKAYTCSVENNKSTYTATDYTYTGLLESSTFGVALSKSGYDVGAIEKKQDKFGNWVINIPLTYNPDDFDIDFSIEMADDVPTELYPDAVIVKIAYWNTETNEWKIISQQETTDVVVRPGVRVDIDPVTGEGSGSYPVWRFDGDNNPYGYRAVVTGFIYDNKTISTVSIKEEKNAVIAYTDGNYTATMGDISDGKLYSSSLYGAYYNKADDAQAGTLHGVITVEKYDVTFDAKGGTVNGKATDVAAKQYYIPELDDYKPTMEDHNFLGWYADENCTIPAEEGKLLTEDITLYAKWDKTLTGTLIVDGYYTDESGTQHKVDDVDRATHALVELEEIFDGHTYDIAGQTVEVEWVAGEHTSEPVNYEFKGLDPDKTYRIAVYLMNYEALYQNSTTVVNGNGDVHDDYNENDYTAVYPEKKLTTFVNTFLHFEPEEYVQNVIVDSSTIGAGFRPTDALVKYYSEEVGVDDDYVLITQHKGDNEGVNVIMGADGKTDGTYGDKVWKKNYNGNLYDYQASLSKLIKEGYSEKVSDWPVSVVYGAPSRYSPLNGAPTGVLQVKLVPNRYGITYNEMYVAEDVNVVSSGIHTWSYETAIDYVPEREGYNFLGWYANRECTGEKVTAIAASVAEDTVLYAKWERKTTPITPLDSVSYIVEHYKENADGSYSLVEEDTEIFAGKIGDTVTATAKTYDGYCLNATKSEATSSGVLKAISGQSDILTLKLFYARNSYEYTVNYLELDTDKELEPAKSGTAIYGTVVTENAVVIDGYTVSGEAAKSIEIDTENNVINFYYAKRTDLVLNVKHVDKTTNEVIENVTKAGQTFGDIVTADSLKKVFDGYSFDSASANSVTIGAGVNEITLYYTRNSYTYTVNYLEEGTNKVLADAKIATAKYGETITETAKAITAYTISGVRNKTIVIDKENNVINFYYLTDIIGGSNGGDGIADKYQKKVIFKVVNGVWNNGTTDDIVKVLTLMKGDNYSADGTAKLTAPVNMRPDIGYTGGSWDITPPTVTSGTHTDTYTYTFEKKQFNYTLSGSDSVTMYEEETVQSEVKITPDLGYDPDKLPTIVKYESADESIATVDQNGKITGVKKGKTTVTVTLSDGNTYTIYVTVKERENITVVFGKTEGIGWYRVSEDGGATYKTVFGNSNIEVKQGTQLIIKAGDLMGDAFTFYVNGNAVTPDENNSIVVTVDGYMLIGALGLTVVVPDTEESLNWFQKIIKAIKDFFAKLFGKN